MAETVELPIRIPDFFICDHLKRPDVRYRMSKAFESWTLHQQGMTIKEIATLLGVHRSTVADRLDNWRVYLLWAAQSGKCAGRVRQLVADLQRS